MRADEYIRGDRDAIGPLNISLVDDAGCLRWASVTDEEMRIIKSHLRDTFGVSAMELCEPFVVLDYDSTVAGIGTLPRSVGGFVPIWRDFDDDFAF